MMQGDFGVIAGEVLFRGRLVARSVLLVARSGVTITFINKLSIRAHIGFEAKLVLNLEMSRENQLLSTKHPIHHPL